MTRSSTPLEYALLGLLRVDPQSGYDLRKTFSTTPMRHYSDSPGSIYPALKRLQSKKWITGAAEAGNGRKRHVFKVTVSGKKALSDWLQKPVTREDVIWHLDQLMLRFAFLDGNVPRRTTLEFISSFERELDSYIRELRNYARSSGMTETTDTGTLAFQFGIESYEANLSWARRVRKQLEGERP
jgi:DNA-binding PadR family transcriptional regulator